MAWKLLEDVIRRASRPYYYLGERRALTSLRNGLRIFVDPADQEVTPTLVSRGWWESEVAHAVLQRLKPGDTAVDAGANCGFFTLLMAKAVGKKGHVYAFEANRHLASLLQQSVRINGYADRVTIFAAPLADRVKQIQFAEYTEHGASGHIVLGTNNQPDRSVTLRDCVTLDSALPAQCTLKLLRMDVEGAESLVLAGGRDVIKRSRDLCIVTEWSRVMSAQHVTPGSGLDYLKACGFEPRTIRGRGREIPTTYDQVASVELDNFVLTRRAA